METRDLKRVGRRSARSFLTGMGQLTSAYRMRPGFLIAGAQRCGTTSLFRMLAQHPQVRPPLMNKGIHYFDTAANFYRGQSFYAAHFPIRRPGESEFATTGEASPYYLFHPLAASRIAAEAPDAKVIVLLRDPVERAFSAYKQETGREFENLTFEAALDAEPQRLAGEHERIVADHCYQSFSHQHHAYVARGQYADQLERMISVVGRENVMVLDGADFFSQGLPQWPELMTFLGLRSWTPPNPVRANSRPSEPMPESIRIRLSAQFESSNARLADLLGRTPSWVS